MSDGFLYRLASADAARLRELVRALVGTQGWTFGGAALWDVDQAAGSANLRPIAALPTGEPLDVRGDFGHAFSPAAEVRWKRRDDGQYDVLILSETPQTIDDADALGSWATSAPERRTILQSGDLPPIRVVYYYAPNGAAQLTRYLEVGI